MFPAIPSSTFLLLQLIHIHIKSRTMPSPVPPLTPTRPPSPLSPPSTQISRAPKLATTPPPRTSSAPSAPAQKPLPVFPPYSNEHAYWRQKSHQQPHQCLRLLPAPRRQLYRFSLSHPSSEFFSWTIIFHSMRIPFPKHLVFLEPRTKYHVHTVSFLQAQSP